MPSKDFRNETARLRAFMENSPNERFTRHAREKMAARGITSPEIAATLSHGIVTWIEFTAGPEKWTVDGKTLDQRSLRIIITLNEGEKTLTIITAFAPEEDNADHSQHPPDSRTP